MLTIWLTCQVTLKPLVYRVLVIRKSRSGALKIWCKSLALAGACRGMMRALQALVLVSIPWTITLRQLLKKAPR